MFFKIQVYELFCWREIPKIYNTFDEAKESLPKNKKARIVKWEDHSWENMGEFE